MIRAVVFDLGNVLVKFSHERMCDQLGRLCGRSGPDVRDLLIGSGLQERFERGAITDVEFRDRFANATGHEIPMAELRHAASDIFEPIDESLRIARRLKEAGYRMVLLSNTSIAHFEFIRERWNPFDLFDALVLSYEVKAIKPEAAIYEAAIAACECPPSQAFYTDDVPAYVEAGRRHGFNAEVFTDPAKLTADLERYGVDI